MTINNETSGGGGLPLHGPDRGDLYSGLLFLGIGALFALRAFSHNIGTPLRMGPGFFPLIVAILLGAVGAVILLQSVAKARRGALVHAPSEPVAWRGALTVIVGPILFGLTVPGLGLLPATALVVFMGALASSDMGWKGALGATVTVTAACIAIFWWGLGIPLRLIGPWIGG